MEFLKLLSEKTLSSPVVDVPDVVTTRDYIVKYLLRTLQILVSQRASFSKYISKFVNHGLRDELLPYTSSQLSFLSETFLNSYLREQQLFLAVSFAAKEHRILGNRDCLPFLRDIKYGAHMKAVRVKEKDKVYGCKSVRSRDELKRKRALLLRLPDECLHVLKLRASYCKGGDNCLVVAPWVEMNLQMFYETRESWKWWQNIKKNGAVFPTLLGWMTCLAATVAMMHSHNVKHMDVRAQNIGLAVKDSGAIGSDNDSVYPGLPSPGDEVYPVFLHYGCSLSFSYSKALDPAGSAIYASPEKTNRSVEGHKGNIFSLGVVFLVLACIMNKPKLRKRGGRRAGPCTKIQPRIYNILKAIPKDGAEWTRLKPLIVAMVRTKPDDRPSAEEVWRVLVSIHKDHGWEPHCSKLLQKSPSSDSDVADDMAKRLSLDENNSDIVNSQEEDCVCERKKVRFKLD